MKTPKQRFPNYIGQPLIPLSPHNNEISLDEQRHDLEALGLAARPDGKKISKIYLSRKAARPDYPWETRVWCALNEPGRTVKWRKSIDQSTGERVFAVETLKISVRCLNTPANTLRYTRPANGKFDWWSITVGETSTSPSNLTILSGVVRDALDHQSRLRKQTYG